MSSIIFSPPVLPFEIVDSQGNWSDPGPQRFTARGDGRIEELYVVSAIAHAPEADIAILQRFFIVKEAPGLTFHGTLRVDLGSYDDSEAQFHAFVTAAQGHFPVSLGVRSSHGTGGVVRIQL